MHAASMQQTLLAHCNWREEMEAFIGQHQDNGSQTMYQARTNNGICNHVLGFWIREEAFIGEMESSAILMGWWIQRKWTGWPHR